LPIILPETIVRRRCAALIPYARNARTHSEQQVAQIAASIREFGFTNPVLIDEEDGAGQLERRDRVSALTRAL
jgi:ParB-like chromosome segregation protein Spo0J